MRKIDRDNFVCAILGFLAGALPSVWIFYASIDLIFKDVDASAWLQAIGSLFGLGVAIYAPSRIYAKEKRERDLQAIRIQSEKESAERVGAKVAAMTLLPDARNFHKSLRDVWTDLMDEYTEHYSDVTVSALQTELAGLRARATEMPAMGPVAESIMNAMAKTEYFLKIIDDWHFIEYFTFNGVIDDPERGIYEVFPIPEPPAPVLKACIDIMENSIREMGLMFE